MPEHNLSVRIMSSEPFQWLLIRKIVVPFMDEGPPGHLDLIELCSEISLY